MKFVELELTDSIIEEVVRKDLLESLEITSQIEGEDAELVIALKKVIQYYTVEQEEDE